MRVFVTGASGFIGSAIVQELLGAGHEVLGLARSDAAAEAVAEAGADVHRGSLEDLDSLRAGAAGADGVIHTAFIHDFSNIAASGVTDQRAVEAIGTVLAGSDRPLVMTSGTAVTGPGRVGTEQDRGDLASHRVASEESALALASHGVRSVAMRLPASVHGRGDHGFVPVLISIARERGVAAYVGDGTNRWPAVHRLDAARLYRLALEQAPAGTVLHGVAEEGIATREIAEAIGRHLELPFESVAPEQAGEHFGWMGVFFSWDIPAASAATRELMGWEPVQPGLLEDLDEGHYFAPEAARAL